MGLPAYSRLNLQFEHSLMVSFPSNFQVVRRINCTIHHMHIAFESEEQEKKKTNEKRNLNIFRIGKKQVTRDRVDTADNGAQSVIDNHRRKQMQHAAEAVFD